MKEETLAFQTIPIDHQNRFKDRISYLYLEYVKIVQDSSGVVALTKGDDYEGVKLKLQLPVASVALLQLGPGTSITNAALTSCARSGCVVQMAGGGGINAYSSITSLSNSSRWAIAQAAVASDITNSKKVAKDFYKKQFGLDTFEGSVAQMRGIEGSLVKKLYAKEARKAGLTNWRRNTKGEDAVNISLNVGNSILYGLAACATGALSMNPALGIIHRGNWKSFLFDIADLYKPKIMIPLAFNLADEDLKEVPKLTRINLRREIHRRDLMKDLFNFMLDTFEPYTPDSDHDRLIGQNGEVEGHTNYSTAKFDKLV